MKTYLQSHIEDAIIVCAMAVVLVSLLCQTAKQVADSRPMPPISCPAPPAPQPTYGPGASDYAYIAEHQDGHGHAVSRYPSR